MNRLQTFHEALIPMIVEGIGARSYLEFGTHQNETIGRVRCERRYGVDLNPVLMDGVTYFAMTTEAFIREQAAGVAPFDVVFIDADHALESVKREFWGIWPHVSDEGLVLLHDTNPETVADTDPGLCNDAWKLAAELHAEHLESMTLPYHPGLTLVRKRVHWGPKV